MKAGMKIKFVSSFSSIVLGISIFTPPALAVVNGEQVPDPKADAPYVVSIWNSDTGDYKDARFECTGTLIAPQIVLTAAHCTTLTTPYFVKVGATALKDNTAFTAVAGVWQSGRYKPSISGKTVPVNDIGLFKLAERFENIPFPTLANAVTAKKINKFTKLKIFGWGSDQNKNIADLLRTSNLLLQDVSAAKAFGKSFNVKAMISAGIKIKSENIWSGACFGDSGGPLISNIDGINVVIGVTSWGAENCSLKYPSIFARASYYEMEIKTVGIKAVEAQSVVVNRAAPIALEEPELFGEAKPGNKLKCSPGKWSNAVSAQIKWESPARVFGSTNSEISILASDGGVEFKCIVLVSGAKTSVRRVLRVSITGSAVLASNPVIAGIVDRAQFKTGQTARCEGWNWRTPVDSERVTWFTSASSQPSVPVNARQIGSGASLTFDSNMLKDENGRYLICQVTGIQNGFETHFTASKYITTPSAPILSSVSINAPSLTNGSSATCTYASSGDVEVTRIDWGYTSVPGFFTQYPGLSGAQTQITSDLAQQASGKFLACRVVVSNSGGEVSKSTNTYNTFASLPNAPIVNTSISGSVVAGSTARCSASYSYGNSGSYAWGKTTSSGSSFIEGEVLSNSSSYTLTTRSLDNLAGMFLTCVVTVRNDAGSVSSASSILIPPNSTTIPQPTSPSVEGQTASSASISVKIRVPSISGYDSSKMIAKLNVVNTSNCMNLNVTPGSLYDCSGLSANTTYTANISVASTSGVIITKTSPNISFTTIGLNSSLYVCGQSCTGALSSSAMQYYLSDKRLIEANAESGGPITSSTCTGSGCNPGTAPSLPVACATGSSERTNVTTNATAQITTHFRYCSAPTDTTSPIISSGTLARTGYAPIIPTSGAAGANIAVRFIATDNIGIANTTVRLINPSNVVVASKSGTFIAGGTTDGVYSATFATASSGPLTGDIYEIQAEAKDASGNTSNWLSLGSYIISGTSAGLTPVFGARTPDYYSPGFKYQIANYDPAYTWTVTSTVGTATINSSGLVSVAPVGAKQSATLTVSTRRTGYTSVSNSVTSVGPWNLSDEIQTQNITASLSGTTLTINVPDARGWNWSVIWDGTVQRTNITSFPYVLTGFSTNKNIQLGATDNLQNYGYSRVFLPTAVVVSPTVVLNSGVFTSGVASSGSISTGQSFGISWRVTRNDQISTTIALIDQNGNSASWVGGALVQGTVQDGTYQGNLAVPANFTSGRYLLCAIAISSTNIRSASQCGGKSEYVQVAELQINGAP